MFEADSGGEADISHLKPEIENLIAIKSQIKVLEAQIEESEQKIKLAMGENSTGYCAGYRVTWKTQSRTALDRKLLEADNPRLNLGDYEKTSSFRVFKIKEEKASE